MSGLRERNKARRRHRILDAALELLRDNDLADVTIEQIAARAEVSPPTIYNLVGTREQLLVALLNRVIEGLVESLAARPEDEDPIANAQLIVDQSAAAFVADSAAFRPIICSLDDLAVSGANMSFDPSRLQVRAMQEAQALGIIREDLDAVALGRQIYLAYMAALNFWAAGRLSDPGFGLAARHGLFAVIAAAATDAYRERYLAVFAELGQRFARVKWNLRSRDR